jgi:hypothetical protein
MEISTLTAFLSQFLPTLLGQCDKVIGKVTESATSKFGEAAFAKAQAIWKKLSPNESLKDAAIGVAKSPDDEDLLDIFRMHLKKLLEQDEELMKEITQILAGNSPDGIPGSQIAQNATGNQNQVIGQITIINYYDREKPQAATNDGTESNEADRLHCPYRDLHPFSPRDAEYFFGRESFVEELVQAMQTRNFIPLLGASGSGKSSVVFAGLVPKLQEAGHWQFTHFRPGTDPFQAIASALVPLYTPRLNETERLAQSRQLAGYLRTEKILLSDVFAQIQQNYPTDQVLLIADQFEELYTLCADGTTRNNFLDKLLTGIFSPTDKTPFAPVLVATMRADFFSTAILYSPFADVLQNANLILKPMDRLELNDIIEKPAEMFGVTFEAGLVKRILDDVDKEPGILPLLEFALTKLWEGRSNNQLTHAAYEEIGKVQGALARHANQEYDKLSEVEQAQVRRIFVQLVRPGEGMEDTRRVALKGELGEESWSLVKKLADARLVVTSRNAAGQETVEVVHEALIRNWGKLQGWMEIDRAFRAWQEQLRVAMRQWQTHKDEGSLLRGAALVEAEEQLQKYPEDLVAESDFIQMSLREQNRIQQTEAARQEHLKQAEEARKKRETIIARRTITGLLVTMMLGIGISATLISSYLLYNEFAYCPKEKGRPGEKIKKENFEETVCFRNLITSGEINIFLSSTNYHLDQGIDAFNNKDYQKAIKLFEQANNADLSDPISRIFWQNAKARIRDKVLKSKGFKSTIIKLAVVTSIDYYEKAATDVLRGVFDAQYKFNTAQEDNDKPLIEIVIANDENEPIAAEKTAQTLIKNDEIIGVIGHHSSESTDEAQKIYSPQNMPIISSTSSSSKIKGE